MKHPMKLAKKEFPKLGAVLVTETRSHQIWEMPWGHRYDVWPSARLSMVRTKIAALQQWNDPMRDFVPSDAPPMDNVHFTGHFLERLALMRTQETITEDDMWLAKNEPHETRYCHDSGAYAYLRGDIAIIAIPHGGGMRLLTLWWTRRDLWDKNPRPERVNNFVREQAARR